MMFRTSQGQAVTEEMVFPSLTYFLITETQLWHLQGNANCPRSLGLPGIHLGSRGRETHAPVTWFQAPELHTPKTCLPQSLQGQSGQQGVVSPFLKGRHTLMCLSSVAWVISLWSYYSLGLCKYAAYILPAYVYKGSLAKQK